MNCAYHIQNNAVVSCSGCGKPLCPACDHRIKGFPYCQDCIVSGVEMLQARLHAPSFVPMVKRQTSPFIAAFLSMVCPGLGAAYNGQTSKALVYFGVFVGLFQLAVTSRGAPLFVLGFIGMWFFAALDSWRTAQAIRSGVSESNAEDILIQRFTNNPKAWGIALALIGGLSLIFAMGIHLPLSGLLPIALIFLGIYLLRDFFTNRKAKDVGFASAGQPSSVVSGDLYETSFRSGDYASFDDYKTQNEARNWKSR